MSPNIIVQFVGFQATPRGREYTFAVREPAAEPVDYVLIIPSSAFDSRRIRYQDAPDICSHKLHHELALSGNHPLETEFCLSDQELDEYRAAHAPKPLKYPYAPRPSHDD
ncbi:MAG: hypothetical protein LAN59_01520 [Acidobacteriia bacterium]|nr:hypothetical protein [Terriglobia bacterium]